MLKRIPKVLLLVALLTALAVSSTPTFGKATCGCFSNIYATNCSFDTSGHCKTRACEPGQPCSYTYCASGTKAFGCFF